MIAITFWRFLGLRLRQASEGKRGYEASTKSSYCLPGRRAAEALLRRIWAFWFQAS